MPVLKGLQVDLGLKKNKTIENNILKQLAIHEALGEVKLYNLVIGKDDKDSLLDYNQAIVSLSTAGLIEIALDKEYEIMNVIRLVRSYQ